jgi:Putative restriction endonuclease
MVLEPIIPPIEVKRWTLSEYHAMIDGGYLGEDDPVELLEGWIVPKMSRGRTHDDCIEEIHYLLLDLLPTGWRIRIQCAMTIAASESEPEPDLFIYTHAQRKRHPVPSQTALVIEVADSSLARDRGTKQRIYARGMVPVYWIVNLPDRQIEVYTEPSGPTKKPKYGKRRFYRNGSSVPVVIAGEEIGRISIKSVFQG